MSFDPLIPCPCQSANREARVASLRNGLGSAVGAYQRLTPAQNLELIKAEFNRARTRYFTRRHAVSLAVRSAREGLPDDLDALAVLFWDWQAAKNEFEALATQVEQAEKEAKSNG